MSKLFHITVRDKNLKKFEDVKARCEKLNISFSAFVVDAVLSYEKKVFR